MATSTNHLNRSFGQSSRASSSTQPYEQATAGTQKFVIGKIDAGIAVLISDSVHLIEFPSLLLPSGVGPGSIVNIACTRNFTAERSAAKEFWDLQREIKECFGEREPKAPNLRIRNTTQTSVTLEWDKLDLASASLISLSIYRNNQRLTTIPSPLTNTSTKLSGLQLDTDYTFHLVLKTSAGTYTSPLVRTKTHTIDNTSGISVCFGFVEPGELLEQAKEAVREMGAKWDDRIQIDTTHFVATSSASRNEPRGGGAGVEYQKAVQLSIPVVSPEWLLSCHRSSKLVPISAFYLGTTNHAASLSSAQLVSSSPSPTPNSQTRQITATTPSGPPPATVQEEKEPEEEERVEAPPPPPAAVQLEENVEGPPEDQRELEQRRDEPETGKTGDLVEAEETDTSTKAVKSEVEERAKDESTQEEEEQSPVSSEPGPTTREEPERRHEEQEQEEESTTIGETEKPTSGVPQEAVIVSDANESAHEVDPEVKQDLAEHEPESSNVEGETVEGIETPRSEAQESVDLDDAFEDTEEDVDLDGVEAKKDEEEVEGDAEKSLVDIEL